jgi:hypothetical protein
MSEEEPKAAAQKKGTAGRRGGCLGRLSLLTALLALLLFLAADYVFNLRSNATYVALRDSTAPLEARLPNGSWKPISALTITELDHALVTKAKTPGGSWRTLAVKRKPSGISQRLVQSLFNARICVI